MLDLYFRSHQVLHRLRSGPAGPFLDGFAAALDAQGYAHKTSIFRLTDAAHLGLWSARHEIPITSLDDQVLARFDRHLPKCRCMGTKHRGYTRAPFRVRTFVEHLRRVGVVAVPTAEPMRAPLPVQEYYAWMRQQRGLTERTLVSYVPLVGALIDALGEDPTRYDATGLRAFVFHRLKHHERHSAPAVTTPVRSFLRYLVAQGRCSADLIGAVPSVPRWRLAKLPPYLPAEDVERIIESCDVRSPSALRDRAMQRAGVEAAAHGAHLLRHSLASRMLREGATLDLIGAVLRHRSVETTALYSKVDVDLLRGVAQPWPGGEVAPC